MYRLMIVEDEPSCRYGLCDCFDWGKYEIEVVGEADDGESALKKISALKPDIVLTDVKMPNMDGLELSLVLQERYNWIKIIFVSGHNDASYFGVALEAGLMDPDVVMAEYRQKLKEAGIDKIDEEYKLQAEDYLKTLK